MGAFGRFVRRVVASRLFWAVVGTAAGAVAERAGLSPTQAGIVRSVVTNDGAALGEKIGE